MIELKRARLAEYPTMQAMAAFYVYDMSEFLGDLPGWEFPETGVYECEDLRPHFESSASHPYFIRVDGELAGFSIVDDRGATAEADFSMAQFFVLRKFKGRGVGRWAAVECFGRHGGLWDVMVIPGNRGANAFWRRVIGQFTMGAFEDSRRLVSHLGGSGQDVFRFRTLPEPG